MSETSGNQRLFLPYPHPPEGCSSVCFFVTEIIDTIEAVNGADTTASGPLRPAVRNIQNRERWDYYVDIFDMKPKALRIIESAFEGYETLTFRRHFALEHVTPDRASAIEIGKHLSGHAVQTHNQDFIVAVNTANQRWIDNGNQLAFESAPDDFLYFSSNRMKEKLSWDRNYTPRPVTNVLLIDPYAVAPDDRHCCRTEHVIAGSHELRKLGLGNLGSLQRLAMRPAWGLLLTLARVEDDALTDHVEQNWNVGHDKLARTVSAMKRSAQLELNGDHYISAHNLRVASGISLQTCERISNTSYLPA